ncbi:MAG: hypothetical protein CSA38_01245 [Flavobacteriales bacterium]|nr:MAG: hypothetical protein CSA38_01245 [Flavobacteriales bacterium]
MRYKILFISSWYPNKLEPTNGNFVQRHAEAVALEHDVEVLHAIGDFHQREHYVFDEKKINGIKTLIVYYKKTRFAPLNFWRRMKAYYKGFQRVQQPNLVHANVLQNTMLFAVWLKKRKGIPFVISEHWSGLLVENQSRLSLVKKWIAQYIAKNTEYILPVSHILAKGIKKLEVKNTLVVGNVVDTDLFSLVKKESEKVVFLHISNLIKIKRCESIIRVASRLYQKYPYFELHIGGDGDVNGLRETLAEYHSQDFTKIFGEITHQEVAKKMQNADCFLIFSDFETQSCTILESFSTGTPVIATNVGGIPEIVSEKRGILVEKGDEKGLFKAMESVLLKKINFGNQEEIRNYAVQHFSKEKVCEQFSSIYHQVLSSTS